MTKNKVNYSSELFGERNHVANRARRIVNASIKAAPRIVGRSDRGLGKAIIYNAAQTLGSLGDQAMLLVAIQRLRAAGYNEILIISEEKPSRRDLPQFPDRVIGVEGYFHWKISEAIRFQREFSSCNGCFILGADIMDGHYSVADSLKRVHLLELASSFGFVGKAFGFSFNESPAKSVVNALRSLPDAVELLARDPVSHRRLESALERPVKLVADLAFLLQPDPEGDSAKATLRWIKSQRAQGARVIGVNANALLARGNYKDPYPVAVGLAKAMHELHKAHPELCFVLISHDSRGAFNDAALNRIVYEIVSFNNAAIRERIFIMPSPCYASEVKAVSAELDLAITGRMHFAIACLGQGTPALCIGYQGKMEGLFEHFELPDMVISPNNAFDSNGLAEMAKAKLEKATELRAHINKRLPKVHSLAELNFST